MSINTNQNQPKTDNLPILRSTSKETKKRFDNLLKNALNQKNETRKTPLSPRKTALSPRKTPLSPRKLKGKNIVEKQPDENLSNIENETTTVTENLNEEEIKAAIENTINRENYILEKFLSDATSIKQEDKAELPLTNDVTYIKPPVPLPRSIKNKLSTEGEESSSTSNLTYSISIPKITNKQVLDDIDRFSFSTASTYNIRKSSKESLYSQTPNENNVEGPKHHVSTIGDIIIHSASGPSKKKTINIVEQKLPRQIPTKIDVSKLQLCEIQEIIDNKYNEIEKRREGNNLNDDTLNSVIEDEEDEYAEETSISTSKLRTQSDSVGGIKPYNYEHLIGVVVYRCDKLLLSNYVNHPCVKVHIVDSVTGKYLRRSRSSEEQTADLTTAHVYPLITKAYNMQEKRSFVPYWEEVLTFDEDFDYMMDYENPVIIFFEILDFLSFSDANLRYSAEGAYSGWHKIAWAFLKTIGKGYLNTEQKLRLQLYKPKKTTILKTARECILHDWWKTGIFTKYPSSIHVCVKKIKNTEEENTLNLDKVAEKKMINHYEADVDAEQDSDTYCEKIRPKYQITWTKKSTHACKIPSKILSEYKTSDKGCFIMKFSNDGYLLAGGVATLTKYPIHVYSITDANIYCKFKGHQGLIYDFNWSVNDVYLISASSDCTVCIWNVSTKEYYPIQTLPHPSFVYCVLLKMLEDTEIVTGCYDKILRVWRADSKVNVGTNYNLKQEVEGHIGYITSICSRKHENIIYSSDSLGVVIEWHFVEKWSLRREFKFKEYLNTIINKIVLPPQNEKLFVFCRDSTIRLIDLKVNCILQWYKGALNDRLLLTGCVTPCGTYVFGSSEDGTICIWNTITGFLCGTYNPYMKQSKVLTIPYCIEYHPFDNMVSFCHYGSSIPILLCIYHRSFIDENLQFNNMEEIPAVKTEKRPRKCKKKKIRESIKKTTNTTTTIDKTTNNVANVSLEGIIDKIDDVLVTAKT